MNNGNDGVESSAKTSWLFTTTHWSVVMTAGQTDTPPDGS